MEGEEGFRSAADLFAALETPDAVARRRTLAWVATNPGAAIALGPEAGRDVVDVLIGLTDSPLEFRYWEDVVIALGVFAAPRVTEFFIGLLERASGAEMALAAATALGRRDVSGYRDRLVAILLEASDDDRVLVAAELLADAEGLGPDAAVRVAALESEAELPSWGPASRNAWVRELNGRFGDRARDRLADQGGEVASHLAGAWRELDQATRIWLVGLLEEADRELAAALLPFALAEASSPLRIAALELATRLGLELPADLVGDVSATADRGLRIALAAAGAIEIDLAREPDDEVLGAALAALARQPDPPVEQIAALLAHRSEAVRAAARSALVTIGSPARVAVRGAVNSDDQAVRAAAVRTLLDLGDDEWLAGELLGDPAAAARD